MSNAKSANANKSSNIIHFVFQKLLGVAPNEPTVLEI